MRSGNVVCSVCGDVPFDSTFLVSRFRVPHYDGWCESTSKLIKIPLSEFDLRNICFTLSQPVNTILACSDRPADIAFHFLPVLEFEILFFHRHQPH